MASSLFGQRVRRLEDPRFLRGTGRFVDDVRAPEVPELEGEVHLAFVRSTAAHARIEHIDLSDALAAPHVVGVFTHADLDLVAARTPARAIVTAFARPWLADEVVRFVGEPVVVVVAETRAAAIDAAELVIVEFDPLDAVVGAEAAADPIAPRLFEAVDSNICSRSDAQLGFDDESWTREYDVVVEGRFVNQRVAGVPLEGRGTVAVWSDDGVTVWTSTQHAHGVARTMAAALGEEPARVRVIAPDVGGGFGAKIPAYPEDVVTAWVSRRVARPARWIETRTEQLLTMGHGRAQTHRYRLAGDRDGRVRRYQLDVLADAGAYPANGAVLPSLTALMAIGIYDIERVDVTTRSVVTNTAPTEAFRGAGRPEATATIEAAMDRFAAAVGLDVVEVRRRNVMAAFDEPVTVATGAVYDSGDYRGALDAVVAAAGYEELRAEQADRRASGDAEQWGIGVSGYVEITAGGAKPTEWSQVLMRPDGSVLVRTGSSPHGQGHETSLAMVVADRLGVPVEAVGVEWGDTASVPRGGGTMGSRSLQLGGWAALNASEHLVAGAAEVAADHLEAAAVDVVFDRDRAVFHVAGTPARSVTWSDVAGHAFERDGELLSAETDVLATGPTYPFGAHVAVVAVDIETGAVRLERLVACDDAGRILNPLLADGQRLGGIAQGVAQALLEEVRYSADGTPLTTNLSDYTFISACELPRIELVAHETPTPYNPLGAKGIGESGTIGATPAVRAAVLDALAPFGVTEIDMPASPERVWSALQAAGRSDPRR